eukprot:SAG11_NODE_15630_length_571_cov_1.129237_1_plen_66_part_01
MRPKSHHKRLGGVIDRRDRAADVARTLPAGQRRQLVADARVLLWSRQHPLLVALAVAALAAVGRPP